jgi:hypothetical protein
MARSRIREKTLVTARKPLCQRRTAPRNSGLESDMKLVARQRLRYGAAISRGQPFDPLSYDGWRTIRHEIHI